MPFQAPFQFPLGLPSTLQTISSYLTRARSRLLVQFQNTYATMPRIDALLQSWEQEIQLVETNLYNVYLFRELQAAIVASDDDLLNKLGNIVGLPRLTFTNAQYIQAIQAKIAANRSHGRRPELLNILTLLIPGMVINITEIFPAGIVVNPLGAVSISAYTVMTWFLSPAKAAGVKIAFVWSAVSPTNTLTLGSVYNPGFTNGPPPTNGGVVSTQMMGSVYNSGFTNGPPPTNAGGGVFAGVVQSENT